MFIKMNTMKWNLLIPLVFFVAVLFAGCGQVSSVPTPTVGIIPTLTPPHPTATELPPTLTPFPTCTPLPVDYIYVIDSATYFSVDAGLELGLGPSGAIDILQEALDEHHPDWGQEENLASDAWSYSHAQNIGVSPRVLLAVTGVALDWQIPENHNLKEAIIQTGIALTQHYREFRFNEEVQANHPEVADAANYALYAFFDYDLEKLDAWQQEYDLMFGEIQPRISIEGCATNQNK